MTQRREEIRKLLEKCMSAAVQIAIVRHGLTAETADTDGDDADTPEGIGLDAAYACFGEGTCDENPIPEVSELMAFAESLSGAAAAPSGGAQPEMLDKLTTTLVTAIVLEQQKFGVQGLSDGRLEKVIKPFLVKGPAGTAPPAAYTTPSGLWLQRPPAASPQPSTNGVIGVPISPVCIRGTIKVPSQNCIECGKEIPANSECIYFRETSVFMHLGCAASMLRPKAASGSGTLTNELCELTGKPHRLVGAGDYGSSEHGQMCGDCGAEGSGTATPSTPHGELLCNDPSCKGACGKPWPGLPSAPDVDTRFDKALGNLAQRLQGESTISGMESDLRRRLLPTLQAAAEATEYCRPAHGLNHCPACHLAAILEETWLTK